MSTLSLKNVCKRYGNVSVIEDLNLEIQDKEFLVLVGPSGCGKSTTLRMIAGLEDISDGEIYIGDTLVNKLPPKDRNIAMVFQSYALYPHMTVWENMAFSLKLRGRSENEIKKKVGEAAAMLQLEPLLDRKPKALSGGQRQRVAMGRALVRRSGVFLLDEPLSNLDAKLRGQMRVELQQLHERIKTTFIYVTHDQVEAMTLGHRIVIMRDGDILQVDTPLDMYEKPVNIFVAGFIGTPAMNFLNGELIRDDTNGDSGWSLVCGSLKLGLPGHCLTDAVLAKKGQKVVVGIRPEHIFNPKVRNTEATPGLNSLKYPVSAVEPMGAITYLTLDVDGTSVQARVDPMTKARVGDIIELFVNIDRLYIFDAETEKNLCC